MLPQAFAFGNIIRVMTPNFLKLIDREWSLIKSYMEADDLNEDQLQEAHTQFLNGLYKCWFGSPTEQLVKAMPQALRTPQYIEYHIDPTNVGSILFPVMIPSDFEFQRDWEERDISGILKFISATPFSHLIDEYVQNNLSKNLKQTDSL